jgi:rhodanese-related sulfurtransferase
VIFHKGIDVPFTVFIVKDRVYNHNPAKALDTYKDKGEQFIDALNDSYNMCTPQWVIEEREKSAVHIIDLRTENTFIQEHIPGSVNILLKDLPDRYKEFQIPLDETIVCLCSGSVQSAYAIMFLYGEGYRNVYNLSGGFGRWVKDGGVTVRSETGNINSAV